jgi:hypothetical protein
MPRTSIHSAALHGCLLKSATRANITWMAKQVPWALTLPRKDCSSKAKPALLPENLRMGSATRRFHPEASSSQTKTPAPAMRWSTRSHVGIWNRRRGTRRTTEAATAGPRANVPATTAIADHGLLGPKTNQHTITSIATNSNASLY